MKPRERAPCPFFFSVLFTPASNFPTEFLFIHLNQSINQREASLFFFSKQREKKKKKFNKTNLDPPPKPKKIIPALFFLGGLCLLAA
jgi:hypothetical protein